MPKRNTDFLKRTPAISSRMAAQDRKVDDRRTEERGELNAVHIDRIKLRAADTRSLNEKHVESLKESITILGLIEPLAVDQEKVLLAGGHRLAAIRLMRKDDKAAFELHFPDDKVPVRIMPFEAASEPSKALQVEIAENEHRRDYTPSEVRNLAERLREFGYKDVKGRPKKDEKALMPALTVVVGKNIRTIQRYLADKPKAKSTTDVVLYLKKAKKSLEKWQKEVSANKADPELMERLPEILELLNTALSNEKKS